MHLAASRLLALSFALLGILIAACSPSDDGVSLEEREGPLRVVATIGMVGDVARAVAGDAAEVEVIVGTGIDPHTYSASRDDALKLMDADVIFYNGLMLEGRMSDSLVRAATAGKKVYPLTEALDASLLLEPEEFEGHVDPHVWNDPMAWAQTASVVRDALIEADPANESVFRENAEALTAQLAELDAYAERVLASVPERSRVLVTAHDAFNYLGSRFGYEVVGIQGISTESEASVSDIERLVEMLVERDIRAVFVETSVPARAMRKLIEDAAALGHEVVIGGELFSDAMGAPGTYEGTYVGMIDHNVTTIARALGGEAPERGMQGKLAE